jgi:hypothetical protein
MNNPLNKWANELNRQFSKEEIQMAIKEMQIKMTLRFHLTPVKMAINNIQTTNAGKDVGEKELSSMVGGNVN